MQITNYIVLILTAFLTGCHTLKNYRLVPAVVENGVVCCSRFSDINFESLELNYKKLVILNRESPVIKIDNEKCYFKAIELPFLGAGRYINFDTYISTNTSSPNVLVPHFLFLNKEFKIVGEDSSDELKEHTIEFFGTKTKVFRGISKVPAQAGYVVIYSSKKPKMPHFLKNERFGNMLHIKNNLVGSLDLSIRLNHEVFEL